MPRPSPIGSDADGLVALEASIDPDTRPLVDYLHSHVAGFAKQVEFYRFTGGNANLTYLVRAGATEYVLKREPPGTKAKAAHDMRREFRMLSALSPHYPLAPQPVLLCEDESVFGGVFCLMQRVSGRIVRQGDPQVSAETESGCMQLRFHALIDALASLHLVNLDAAGLAGEGRPETYRTRQVHGWCKRYQDAKTDGADSAEDIITWLTSYIPTETQLVSIIHNDFKMDNLVWDSDQCERLIGVLDWEMSTVGDPIMDLACTLSFWVEENDPAELRQLRAMPSDHASIPTRMEAIQRYCAQTGWKFGEERFYRCFGLFRRAAIEQQKYRRFATGQTQDPRYINLGEAARVLLEACRAVING